jgi:hypothetical protein
MTQLLPCSGCSRHVRASDRVCPFCGEALPLSLQKVALPTKRLGRAATMAFGVAIAASACGGGVTPGSDAGSDGGQPGVDSGSQMEDAGGTPDAGTAPDEDAGSDAGGGIVPAYGGIPPADAGNDRRDAGGGVVALYGAPPSPAD